MKKHLLLYFFCITIGQSTFAQTPHFRNYTVDDGLPSSMVYRAFQDSKGFIWFCTNKGLARFDGYKFEKFTTKNGLPNNDIWQCAEDSHHRIWFLSYANAFFYFDLNDNQFHSIENPYKEYHDSHIWCFVEEANGEIQVVINPYLVYFFIDTKQKTVRRTYFTGKTMTYPVVHGKEIKYIQETKIPHSNGITAYSEGLQHNLLHKKHIIPDINKISDNYWLTLRSLTFDDDKTIYGSNDSISYFKNQRFYTQPFRKLSKYPDDQLSHILNTGDANQKLVVTNKDIFVIDEHVNRDSKLDFIKDFSVNTIFFDSEKNLWLCTKDKGIYLVSKQAISSNTFATFTNSAITCITKDKHDRVWFGTNTGKVYYTAQNGGIKEQKTSLTTIFPVKSIKCSPQKLAITWNTDLFTILPLNELGKDKNIDVEPYLLLKDDRKQHKINDHNKRFMHAIKSFDFLSNDMYLIGNNRLDIWRETSHFYEYKTLLDQNKILTLHHIDSNIYAGTNKGLMKITATGNLDNKFEKLKQKQTTLRKPIACFASDNQNNLWVGTDGYGVYELLKGGVRIIPELAGLIINHLYFEKENNRLFVSTNEGIYVLKLNPQNTYVIQKISLAQGLPTLEVNAVVVRKKELFVATTKGLALLSLEDIEDKDFQKNQEPLIIKNIKINRQDTTVLQRYDLNYRQNNLDVEFVALSYKSDKNIKYDYKMLSSNDGADTTWHQVADLHKEFSLLSPGKYEFHLRAFDINGNPTKSVKPIVFVINPPFWETLWFKLLIASIVLLGIVLFFYIRTRNIQKKEAEKTAVNKKFAELELQALQAQMNPHFVFNALSAIQNFILNNDTEQATSYLSRFSRLMRLFLESSRNKYIALSDEKTLLEYYIELEQLRFKDKFNSEITIDPNVSMDTEIPSMLLQPFVENAINHGLVYKKQFEGLLEIHISRENSKLICVIEDNGIGRSEAAAIKNKSLKPYKSRSTEITEDRLRSLELIENTKIEIAILDKIDENQKPRGTKVTIVMYL